MELEEVTNKISSIRWQDQTQEQYHYIDLSSVDRNTHNISETVLITKNNAPSRAQQIVQKGDVIFGTTRPMLKRYSIITDRFDGQICSTGFCVLRPDNKKILTSFLFHLLGTKDFYSYVEANERGASYPAIPDGLVKKFKIPVPPLAFQREIVKTLDSFNDLETELEAELGAELEARKMQYQHYREALLDFENGAFIGSRMKWMKLSDIADFKNGKGHEKLINESGKFVVVNSKFVSTDGRVRKYAEEQISPVFKDDLLMVMSDLPNGKALAKCFLVDENEKYTLNQRICALTVKETNELLVKFFYFILTRNKQLLKFDNGVDQTNLRKEDILEMKIPIPPMKEQIRIVKILESFESVVNGIEDGLSAEITARRQQYEYYRDQLLSFMEIA